MSAKIIRAAAALGLTLLPLLVTEVRAQLPVSDGQGGMTCQYHLAAVRAQWERRGADWTDAAGVPFGDEPYARVRVLPSRNRQRIEWDVTELARQWAAGTKPTGALMLRNLGGGTVVFGSRENADPEMRPVLAVEGMDGNKTRWQPLADTAINCTTVKSLGAAEKMTVSSVEPVVFLFPFDARGGKAVRSARLILTSDKQRGKGSEIGVFRLTPPWIRTTEVEYGLAASYPGDRNIESHPAVFFAESFEHPEWSRRWSTFGKYSQVKLVANDRSHGFKPLQGKALEVGLVPSQNLGLDLRYDFAKLHETEPEEAYFRYYLRFGSNWNPTRDGGKLPGFAGTYNRGGWGRRIADGRNGWSTRGAFLPIPPGLTEMENAAGIGSYVYQVNGPRGGGEVWGWGRGPTGRLNKNRWYCIEQYVRMNDPSVANGVLRAWIDGQMVFERTDLHFRDVPELRIENVWFNVYHGGVEKPPQAMNLYIDNIVIARDYIGPMSSR